MIPTLIILGALGIWGLAIWVSNTITEYDRIKTREARRKRGTDHEPR